jgi:hypothetical protein
MKHRSPLRQPDLDDFRMPTAFRRDLRDGLCEFCSALLTLVDEKAGHSICGHCRRRFDEIDCGRDWERKAAKPESVAADEDAPY